jgi:hypothetical protein
LTKKFHLFWKKLKNLNPLPKGPISDLQLEESKKYDKYNHLKLNRFERVTSLEKKFSGVMDSKLLDFTKACLMLNPKYRLKINECITHSALESQLKTYVNQKIEQRQSRQQIFSSAYQRTNRFIFLFVVSNQ